MSLDKSIIGDNLYYYSTGLSIDMFHKISAAGRSHGFVPLKPSFIGRPDYKIVMGKMAGKSAVRHKLGEIGVEATDEQLLVITERVKQEGTLRKGPVDDVTLKSIALEVKGTEIDKPI